MTKSVTNYWALQATAKIWATAEISSKVGASVEVLTHEINMLYSAGFEVTVGGEVGHSETVTYNQPGEYYDWKGEVKIPYRRTWHQYNENCTEASGIGTFWAKKIITTSVFNGVFPALTPGSVGLCSNGRPAQYCPQTLPPQSGPQDIMDLDGSVYRISYTTSDLLRNSRVTKTSAATPHLMGDYDGDGRPDIAGLNVAGDSLYMHRNTSSPGSPSKAAGQLVGTGWATVSNYMAGDYDGDGKDDIIGREAVNDRLLLWRSTSSNGTFSFAPFYNFGTGWNAIGRFLSIA